MTIERFRGRIQNALSEMTPALLRPYASKLADPLLDFALDLLLEAFELDAPDLLAQIEANPAAYAAMAEKLAAARASRTRTP